MIQLMQADDVVLGYYHPEDVDLDSLKKYRVEGMRGLFVSAADVKNAVGEEKWRVLSSEVTSYLFEENIVTISPDRYNKKPTGPTTKKRMAVMSHLSDVQEILNQKHGGHKDVMRHCQIKINFVKRLILDDRPMCAQIPDAELDAIYEEENKRIGG